MEYWKLLILLGDMVWVWLHSPLTLFFIALDFLPRYSLMNTILCPEGTYFTLLSIKRKHLASKVKLYRWLTNSEVKINYWLCPLKRLTLDGKLDILLPVANPLYISDLYGLLGCCRLKKTTTSIHSPKTAPVTFPYVNAVNLNTISTISTLNISLLPFYNSVTCINTNVEACINYNFQIFILNSASSHSQLYL